MPADNSTEKEDRFMAECLKNLDVARGKVDMCAVASALGYSNARSAGNRFKVLKTKHAIKLDCYYAGSAGSPTASPNSKTARAKKAVAKKDKPTKDEKSDKEESQASDVENI